MTVCIAARCGDFIVCASDRMLTNDDVQFEPNRQKIYSLTPTIVVMTAGDTSFMTMVLANLIRLIQGFQDANGGASPNVGDVVLSYVDCFSELRGQFAEDALLLPLGLTRQTFLEQQSTMNDEVVRKLTAGILDFYILPVEVIVAGRDPDGQTSIYTIKGINVQNLSTIGFAAVGIGARHAESQLMLSRYAWDSSLSDGLLHTYFAKKRAEIAPGVGTETDLVVIQPATAPSVMVADSVKERLEAEYRKMVVAEGAAAQAAKAEIASFIGSLLPGDPPPPPNMSDTIQS